MPGLGKVNTIGTAIAVGIAAKYLGKLYEQDHVSYSTAIWLSLLLIYPLRTLYVWYLYPIWLSPLRSLPTISRKGEDWKSRYLIPVDAETRLRWMETHESQNGLLRYIDLAMTETIMVTEPKTIGEFLQAKQYHYIKVAGVKNFVSNFLGLGLSMIEGDEHRRIRQDILPAFSFRVIKDLYPIFWGKCSEMVTLLKKEIEENAKDEKKDRADIEMASWAGRATLDIIGLAGFSSNFNSLAAPDTQLNKAYRGAFTPIMGKGGGRRRLWAMTMLFDSRIMFKLPIKRARTIRDGIQEVTSFIAGLLEERRAELIENKDNLDFLRKNSKKDVISTAMYTGNFTTENLITQSKTMLGAGHETNATAFTWAIFLLTRPENLHVQDKLREEVRARLPSPSSGIEVHAELLDSLPYLEAVSKEVMRVYAPFQSIGRVAIHDTELGGVRIPKGTTVRACPYAINKNKKLWGEDAHEFKPERWLTGDNPKNGNADHLAYITFSHGPRDCLGKSFAMGENKALVAALVGSFKLRTLPPYDVEQVPDIAFDAITRLYGGLPTELTIVDGW